MICVGEKGVEDEKSRERQGENGIMCADSSLLLGVGSESELVNVHCVLTMPHVGIYLRFYRPRKQ